MDIEYREFETKCETYGYINENVEKIIAETDDVCAVLANISALLKMELRDTNWAGFYLMKGGVLILGPFQGKPAVVRIEPGSGVCGTAVAENRAQIVEDVHKCTNHIACDAASSSEIVVPIYAAGELFGVIDIDSPSTGMFDGEDLTGLTETARLVGSFIERTGR